MDNEFNDLNTDNCATTFNNSPDNTATSDELEASSVYTDKMGTNYSKSKKVLSSLAGIGITVTAGAGGLFILNNSFLKAPAKISEVSIVPQKEENSLSYSFTITNDNDYSVIFSVSKEKEIMFSLDVSKPKQYEGKVEGLKREVNYHYSFLCTNNVDYNSILLEEDFILTD